MQGSSERRKCHQQLLQVFHTNVSRVPPLATYRPVLKCLNYEYY